MEALEAEEHVVGGIADVHRRASGGARQHPEHPQPDRRPDGGPRRPRSRLLQHEEVDLRTTDRGQRELRSEDREKVPIAEDEEDRPAPSQPEADRLRDRCGSAAAARAARYEHAVDVMQIGQRRRHVRARQIRTRQHDGIGGKQARHGGGLRDRAIPQGLVGDGQARPDHEAHQRRRDTRRDDAPVAEGDATHPGDDRRRHDQHQQREHDRREAAHRPHVHARFQRIVQVVQADDGEQDEHRPARLVAASPPRKTGPERPDESERREDQHRPRDVPAQPDQRLTEPRGGRRRVVDGVDGEHSGQRRTAGAPANPGRVPARDQQEARREEPGCRRRQDSRRPRLPEQGGHVGRPDQILDVRPIVGVEGQIVQAVVDHEQPERDQETADPARAVLRTGEQPPRAERQQGNRQQHDQIDLREAGQAEKPAGRDRPAPRAVPTRDQPGQEAGQHEILRHHFGHRKSGEPELRQGGEGERRSQPAGPTPAEVRGDEKQGADAQGREQRRHEQRPAYRRDFVEQRRQDGKQRREAGRDRRIADVGDQEAAREPGVAAGRIERPSILEQRDSGIGRQSADQFVIELELPGYGNPSSEVHVDGRVASRDHRLVGRNEQRGAQQQQRPEFQEGFQRTASGARRRRFGGERVREQRKTDRAGRQQRQQEVGTEAAELGQHERKPRNDAHARGDTKEPAFDSRHLCPGPAGRAASAQAPAAAGNPA